MFLGEFLAEVKILIPWLDQRFNPPDFSNIHPFDVILWRWCENTLRMYVRLQLPLCSLENESDVILSSTKTLPVQAMSSWFFFFSTKNDNIVEYCVTDLLLIIQRIW